MRGLVLLTTLFIGVLLTGCSVRYVTPASGVDLSTINDLGIKERFATKPAATFPARIVLTRIEQPGYFTRSCRGFGEGAFSIITTRDIERDEDYAKLNALPQVAGLATLNRLLVPRKLDSVRDLRLAAANLHADLLLVYTVDTGFRVEDRDVGPLSTITLGFLPNKRAYITTTASAVLYDVRTGHLYGMAEATETTDHIASFWSKEEVVDKARMKTEAQAFAKLVDQFRETWLAIVKQYAAVTRGSRVAAAPNPLFDQLAFKP